jgi:hypothetical protein
MINAWRPDSFRRASQRCHRTNTATTRARHAFAINDPEVQRCLMAARRGRLGVNRMSSFTRRLLASLALALALSGCVAYPAGYGYGYGGPGYGQGYYAPSVAVAVPCCAYGGGGYGGGGGYYRHY